MDVGDGQHGSYQRCFGRCYKDSSINIAGAERFHSTDTRGFRHNEVFGLKPNLF